MLGLANIIAHIRIEDYSSRRKKYIKLIQFLDKLLPFLLRSEERQVRRTYNSDLISLTNCCSDNL
jgi:hypothetical protein